MRACDDEEHAGTGYVGIEKREEVQEGGKLDGKDLYVAAKRSTARTEEQGFQEHSVSSVRSPVEHPYYYLKDIIRRRKTPYKGVKKNNEMLCLVFAIGASSRRRRAGSRATEASRPELTC